MAPGCEYYFGCGDQVTTVWWRYGNKSQIVAMASVEAGSAPVVSAWACGVVPNTTIVVKPTALLGCGSSQYAPPPPLYDTYSYSSGGAGAGAVINSSRLGSRSCCLHMPASNLFLLPLLLAMAAMHVTMLGFYPVLRKVL